MSAKRMAALAVALAALAAGCASVQKLAAEERWYDACRKCDEPAEEAALAAALLERLDARIAVEVVDEDRVRAVLGPEGAAFAAERPIVAIRTEHRVFHERTAWDAFRSVDVGIGSFVVDGRGRWLASSWTAPAAPPSSPAPTAWGDFARAMGALVANVLVGPLETVTGGKVDTGVRRMVEGAAGTVADAVEAVDGAVDALTAPADDGVPPPATFAEALNRLLEAEECAEADGVRTCVRLRYLSSETSFAAERDEIRGSFLLSAMEDGEACHFGRHVRLPLPPGATLAERIDLAFAGGPRRLADLEIAPE
jgi:hypothetical protein